MNNEKIVKILGRKQYTELLGKEGLPIGANHRERILITGANGSIGTALSRRLKKYDITCLTTDIEGDHKYMDVTDFQNVLSVTNKFNPTKIINIAGAKHAPLGEREIWKTLSINTLGTRNLIDSAPRNCKVILTSTCKANNPEIVYGASKLIAEKMTLSSGGSVARYFNVVETSGNVFEIWDNTGEKEPIKVAEECERHFISVEESVGLIIYAMTADPGRYIVNSPLKRNMQDIANDLYPDREKTCIKPRTGDRVVELFKSSSEEIESLHLNSSIIKLRSIHD
tara:strand:- start:1549 stop:2397 length:849 start_codon:yes stop_codon:yes gene_type:complete